ncbi:MAG: bifunctional riboflavin kinase/FAD synthetase [Neisseria sp.]|jgi:riboflavin biosynthesis protein ribF|uniref:Riboflavin biosynthesis protein n=1 Tax=Neisseria mucosa (strain ATCC 25996 / DSM 4631 / NCTC 10774 / M26) TaxID=546266 RepID=D2ZTB4_NEIM2|nr:MULTISPECIES: bifunctional riboflavin kinase/FAD synthetase [Neisseria]MBS5837151.1 bifunctional riboflavin kinase/FAD synthetase [Neisseria sp.]OFN31289.1 bifunctional riboflavin kinase/FMN adenylyltransferase [Neisseria sp. HMSC059F02]OHR42469.1 bifunctional riboflavin kinase/FMN adenylyltransferase [Neisseria sp. HMSC070E12]EFC89434.1 riboflavin biosynthesis protein RibF [Neisseria mucosa ATCC 25996]MBS6045541.1 bifunctional riboflavin kinase/FAD synthetase [Neisseria sp.]
MKIWLGQHRTPDFPQGSAVTIGNFDGVHLGHKHILQKLKQEADARGLPVVVVIFEPQPKEFFARQTGKKQPYRISPLRTKLNLLEQTGCVDAVWVLRFNQTFADMDAQDFINLLLRKTLNTRYLLIGDDFRFGAGRRGDFELLATQPDIQTDRTPSVIVEDIRTSSTAVRNALSEGRLDYAKKLLGHDYTLSGKVKHGKKLGRTINAPTANIQLPPHHYALSGVFVVEVDGTFGTKRGVASFGFNPTVSNNRVQKLEVHLFDFNENIYGQRLNVRFLHKLRDEKKFDSIAELKVQIEQDMKNARHWSET